MKTNITLQAIITLLIMGNIYSQEFSIAYTNEYPILHFSINDNEDHIAIGDQNGLKLIIEGQAARYSNISYEFYGKKYYADLKNIRHIEIAENNSMYVATQDSSVLYFYDGEFYGGIPMFIYDGEMPGSTYWCLFELISEFDLDLPLFGEFDVEDGDIYVDCYEDNCFGIPFNPTVYSYDRTAVFIRDLQLVNYLNSEEQFNNTFEPSLMPFQKIHDAVLFNLVNYPQTEFRHKLHLWTATDKGLGLYRSLEGLYDFDDWVSTEWELYNALNSPLLGNQIDQIIRVKDPIGEHSYHLAGSANVPHPVFYFINGGRNPAICSFDHSNSLLHPANPITDICSNFSESLFISQGNRIIEFDFYNFECAGVLSSVSDEDWVKQNVIFSNPFSDKLIIDQRGQQDGSTGNLVLSISTILGLNIYNAPLSERNEIESENWPDGVYIAVISNGDNILQINKIVKNSRK